MRDKFEYKAFKIRESDHNETDKNNLLNIKAELSQHAISAMILKGLGIDVANNKDATDTCYKALGVLEVDDSKESLDMAILLAEDNLSVLLGATINIANLSGNSKKVDELLDMNDKPRIFKAKMINQVLSTIEIKK